VSGHPPQPVADALSAPYWEGTSRGELVLARCGRCGFLSHPPDVVCPRCHDPHVRYRFERMGGSGSVRSWVIIRQSFLPGFEVPFLLVDVAIDEDPDVRLIGRYTDWPDATPVLDERVLVTFDLLDDGFAVPAFAREVRP